MFGYFFTIPWCEFCEYSRNKLRECWEMGGGGGKRSFTLINRGVKKVLTQRKGVVINVFELKYHV
jgi:hypothetical protein